MTAKTHGCLLFLLLTICSATSAAEEIRIAVATNFLSTLNEITTHFEQDTGHSTVISSGSSGTLYAQIKHGAPFDVFFSADAMRPRLLEEDGFAVQGSRFTYAVGRLTLWSPDRHMVKEEGNLVLSNGDFSHLAIANPRTAPYGAAAKEVLHALGLWESIRDRLVRGDNIGQTFHFVFSKNAQLGFVALSQVLSPAVDGAGSRWDVPAHLHAPLRQQAVLLHTSQHRAAATAFLDYVKDTTSRTIMTRFGYEPD